MTQKQNMEALATANEVRVGRAAMRRAIFAGRTTIAEAMEDPCCASMTTLQLLTAQYRVGEWRALQLCSGLAISPNRKLENLTERQREALAEACR